MEPHQPFLCNGHNHQIRSTSTSTSFTPPEITSHLSMLRFYLNLEMRNRATTTVPYSSYCSHHHGYHGPQQYNMSDATSSSMTTEIDLQHSMHSEAIADLGDFNSNSNSVYHSLQPERSNRQRTKYRPYWKRGSTQKFITDSNISRPIAQGLVISRDLENQPPKPVNVVSPVISANYINMDVSPPWSLEDLNENYI